MGLSMSTEEKPHMNEIRIHKKNGRPYIYEFCGYETMGWCDVKKFLLGKAGDSKRASTIQMGHRLPKFRAVISVEKIT